MLGIDHGATQEYWPMLPSLCGLVPCAACPNVWPCLPGAVLPCLLSFCQWAASGKDPTNRLKDQPALLHLRLLVLLAFA